MTNTEKVIDFVKNYRASLFISQNSSMTAEQIDFFAENLEKKIVETLSFEGAPGKKLVLCSASADIHALETRVASIQRSEVCHIDRTDTTIPQNPILHGGLVRRRMPCASPRMSFDSISGNLLEISVGAVSTDVAKRAILGKKAVA